MSDLNSMTRIVGKHRVPCIVIDKETGQRLQRHAIDAREMVASGRYEWANDVTGVAVPEVKLDSHGNPIALINVVVPEEPVVLESVVLEPQAEVVEVEVDSVVVADAPPAPHPDKKLTKKAVKGARKK